MRFKKTRFGPRLVAAARSGGHYRDVHVFIGGTGAVGGAAALQMVAMFEEMMTISPPATPDDVPVLIVTGRSDDEVRTFESRLKRYTRTRWGAGTVPRHFEHGFLTPGGVYVAVSKFELKPVPGLEIVSDADVHSRAAAVEEFLSIAGVDGRQPHDAVRDGLMRYVRASRPITSYLEDRLSRLRDYGPKPYRSVLLGFPLPTILSYQTGGLAIVGDALGLGAEFTAEMKDAFESTFADDLAAVGETWGARVLVAHTTGVGGMYDETPDGHTTPRLGFAHAARDEALRVKHIEAEHLTDKYAKRGVFMLVTAAAIGIDEVRTREQIPLHRDIVKALRDAPHELFRGSRERRQFIEVYKPTTLHLQSPSPAAAGKGGRRPGEGRPLHFKRGEELRPLYAIRSGENGFFSVANADALYRVMKVASVSELGHVLAAVGLLGDDPNVPWFENQICYYTETASSKQVFDFLYQPVLLDAQLSGIDPMALQDLGSAKHQAELHTLSLLILLHRLRTLDVEALEQEPDESFNPRRFFLENSRALTFRDVEAWDLDALARDLRTLVTAEKPGQLLPIKPLIDPGQFGARDEAHLAVMKVVLDAVFAVPSLGSPIVVEDERGQAIARTGYWIAPLGKIVTSDDSLQKHFADAHSEAASQATAGEYQAFSMAVHGFIDLRPIAIVSSAKVAADLAPGAVTVHRDDASFAARLQTLEPYTFFATCGLIAVVHRLRALGRMLTQARTDLGTMQDWLWTMLRDPRGHTYIVPGVVEALRMISEAQEKTTGTEWLDGIWGYERRLPKVRADEIVANVKAMAQKTVLLLCVFLSGIQLACSPAREEQSPRAETTSSAAPIATASRAEKPIPIPTPPDSRKSAELAIARNDFAGAEKHYAEALVLSPADPELRNNYAAVLARIGKDKEALEQYDEAIRLRADHYEARMNVAALLSRMGRNDDAAKHLLAAAKLQPTSPEPNVYLALVYANQSKFDEAAKQIDTALSRDAESANRLFSNAVRMKYDEKNLEQYRDFLKSRIQ